MKQINDMETFDVEAREGTLYVRRNLLISNADAIIQQVMLSLKTFDHDALTVNLNELQRIDSIGVAALNHIRKKMGERGVAVHFIGGQEHIRKKMELFSMDETIKIQREKRSTFFEALGEGFYGFVNDYLRNFLVLIANVVYWSVSDIFRSKLQRKGEFYNQAVLIGVNAAGIVAAMSFIIGLVLALQSASQLRHFGANIYIVDLTVIAMMREMGPLITAILVAGRSGSAIAAELATMKVTSELDALKTMGLHPVRFVVIPKMHGSIITMPFLTILANIMGIIGGIVIAYWYLDITPLVFINRMAESLTNRDILIGIFKSLVFASIIVVTGSFFGLMVKHGAEGVGRVTTNAVVASLSLVFVADSLLGLIFY